MEEQRLTEEQRRLVEDNYPLVPYVIKNMSLDAYEDWHGIACIGLCNAAKTWDVKRGLMFSTYAVRCIKNEVIHELSYKSRQRRRGDEYLLSMDVLLNDSEGANTLSVHDVIPDREQSGWESVIETNMMLERLSEQEKRYIVKHMRGYRLREIGEMEGVSAQRVSLVINRARGRLQMSVV